MKPFMFVIRSVPLPKNKNYRTIKQAIVHIWVIASDIDSAKLSALTYISSLDWNPLSIEHAFEISEEQISHLHKDEFRLYQKALHYGISADFLSSPIREKSSDSPIEYGCP